MKVTVEHDNLVLGVFNKTSHFVVKTKFELTKEEEKIITEMGLQNEVVFETSYPTHLNGKDGDKQRTTFGKLLSGTEIWSTTILSNAKAYEVDLIEALKRAKNFLEINATRPESPKVYEI